MDSIKDYLKYYIGSPCQMINEDDYTVRFNLTAYNYNYYREYLNDIKPVLRKLSSITDEEAIELAGLVVYHTEFVDIKTYRDKFGDLIVESKHDTYNATGEKTWSGDQFHYLLSRGFWLFGDEAFAKGLIIEKQ